jgi:hypothetical protein
MSDGISTTGAKPDMGALLGISAVSQTAPLTLSPGADSPPDDEDVSVAGVMLLTAVSVAIAIAGVFALALFVIACWWVIVHIPVPPFVTQLLAKLGLA